MYTPGRGKGTSTYNGVAAKAPPPAKAGAAGRRRDGLGAIGAAMTMRARGALPLARPGPALR
jgi:hypothetical protein